MENYPSNSKRPKEEPKEPQKIEKVVAGSVVRRKKPLGKRLAETFVGGSDARSVWGYVLYDVLIPAAKDTVSDAVSQGIERMLFGESRGRSPHMRARNAGHTNYQRYSSTGPINRREDPRREMSRVARSTHNFDEIILSSRHEAEGVIDKMLDVLSQYEIVTVSQLYEMLGVRGDFPDEKYGWVDLSGAGVTRIKNGYLLDLPQPEPIN